MYKPTGRPRGRPRKHPPKPPRAAPVRKSPRAAAPVVEVAAAPDVEEERLPGEPLPDQLSQAVSQLQKPFERFRKTIDVGLLRLSGRYLHQDNEAAAFQRMSPSWFGKMMARRDKDTGLTYRELFDQERAHGRASLLRIAMQHCQEKGSAGVNMTKYLLANEFGFSENTTTKGSVKHDHRHTHQTIPADRDLEQMSDRQLMELAAGQAGGKQMTKH